MVLFPAGAMPPRSNGRPTPRRPNPSELMGETLQSTFEQKAAPCAMRQVLMILDGAEGRLAPDQGPFNLAAVKLLFIGDIVGEPGRRAVKILVPVLRLQHRIDVVVANGENSAGGSGITPKMADEIFSAGVDVITSGDHLWDQKEVTELLAHEPRFLRPANYPSGVSGKGSRIFRDVHVIAQHITVLPLQYEQVGKAMLGIDLDPNRPF